MHDVGNDLTHLLIRLVVHRRRIQPNEELVLLPLDTRLLGVGFHMDKDGNFHFLSQAQGGYDIGILRNCTHESLQHNSASSLHTPIATDRLNRILLKWPEVVETIHCISSTSCYSFISK